MSKPIPVKTSFMWEGGVYEKPAPGSILAVNWKGAEIDYVISAVSETTDSKGNIYSSERSLLATSGDIVRLMHDGDKAPVDLSIEYVVKRVGSPEYRVTSNKEDIHKDDYVVVEAADKVYAIGEWSNVSALSDFYTHFNQAAILNL